MKTLLFALIFLLQTAFAVDQLIVIRHGQAEHNVRGVYNCDPHLPGYFPSHLTEKGKEEVCHTAHYLLELGYNDCQIAKVYSSPLPRTIETSEKLSSCGLFSKDKIVIEPLITEVNFGALEGQKITPDWKKEEYRVETSEHIHQRVEKFLHEIQMSSCEGTVIVVTHGGIATAIIKQLTGRNEKVKTATPVILPLKNLQTAQY